MNQVIWYYLQYICVIVLTTLVMSSTLLGADHNKEKGDDARRTLRSSFSTSIVTLDPAIAYDWSNYQVSRSLGCRLLKIFHQFPNIEDALQPQLASGYTVSSDLRSYTFTLNKNWYFHNGRGVVAEDVKYTLERVLNKKTASPGASFLSGIMGEQDYHEGKTDHIVGIEVLSTHRLRITLDRPRVSFLFGLGSNFSSIVPHEEVAKGNFDKFPVGCGPFKVKSFEADRLVLEASSYYPQKDQLYWNKITYALNEDHKKASLRLLRGKLDLIQSFFTTTLDANPSNNPELAKYISKAYDGQELSTIFLSLNSKHPQLSDVRVRKAINMAIDKERLIKLFVKDSTLATQVLPPSMPGYNPDQKGYTYDPDAARELLKQAGLERGFTVELLVLNQAWMHSVALAIQSNLMEVGIRAKVRSEPLENYVKIAGDPEKANIVYSEGVAWFADYPEPSSFYWPLFSKESLEHSWNWANYESEVTDELARRADAFVMPEHQMQRLGGWSAVYQKLHREAVLVPLYHNSVYLLKSPEIVLSKQSPSSVAEGIASSDYYLLSSRKLAQ